MLDSVRRSANLEGVGHFFNTSRIGVGSTIALGRDVLCSLRVKEANGLNQIVHVADKVKVILVKGEGLPQVDGILVTRQPTHQIEGTVTAKGGVFEMHGRRVANVTMSLLVLMLGVPILEPLRESDVANGTPTGTLPQAASSF